MPLLEKINKKYLLWGIAGIAVLICMILLIVLQQPQQSPEPTTGIPVPASLYTPDDFAMDANGFMTCRSQPCNIGIDVSEFQGEIDWQQVRAAGVEFAFIRIGGRGTTQGGLYTDSYALNNYQQAKAAGIQVGVYFFSQAVDPEEAREEALFVLRLIEGWKLDLPVVYDWEWVSSDARTANVERNVLTECTVRFCQTIQQAGFVPAVYFNYSQAKDLLDLSRLGDYPFWLAYYENYPDFDHPLRFWQYSCTGIVPGIEGNVDLNIQFLPT